MCITFPLSSVQQVGSEYTAPNGTLLEPSGLVVLNDMLYMASNNGYLMGMNVRASLAQPWTQIHNFTNDDYYEDDSERYDLECITSATGKLMLGVEGNSDYSPRILRYNTVYNDPTGSIWKILDSDISDLPNNKGMEAIAFVPWWACPKFEGNVYYRGYFFAAYQGKPGDVYVYALPKGNRRTHTIDNHLRKFSIDCQMMVSDMCFADNHLFVLFDGSGHSTPDELHLFTIHSDRLEHIAASYLPNNGSDFEGITIDGSNLYLAKDADDSTNGVWLYRDYSIDKFLDT